MCFRPTTPTKIKVCPNCGAANPRTRLNCIKCDAQLKAEENFEYVELPSNDEEVKEIIDNDEYEETVNHGLKTGFDLNSIIGESDQMIQAKKLAKRFAPSSANILLIGESGTGKELFAQAIHNQGRPEGNFVVLNCAAIPRNLIESELFGYDAGAFTGAKKGGSQGKIELAERGTLFLDEIGDMPLETQAVLLRVLENKQVLRVGGQQYRPVDFRLIAATNKDLQIMVEEGSFRLDLFYRLSVLTVNIPPLRQRGVDIISLAKFLIKKHCPAGSKVPVIDKDAQYKLLDYHWPGNVRQLENAMIYALHIYEHDIILPKDLPLEVMCGIRNSKTRVEENVPSLTIDQPSAEVDQEYTVRNAEENAIRNAMLITGNNIAKAAEILGLSKSTLYRKVKSLGIK
ncbi:sigma 54-interacting transcriptional regulator [Dehalobacter sp. DCM]|uniref:sigma 54-interacting transcriptional regulator n=1 Tax=Dehalobacter sp. DCM TaxID=2907827 RepID=UPI0030821A4A|nr:sigma 54-interacting transcriptional regulator [Dehalobacter sp. DCM]